MIIADDKVVSFHYRLKDQNDQLLEQSDSDHPALYLHGHAGMLPGLVTAMTGRQAGDSYTVTLSPQEGYGPRQEGASSRVALKHVRLPGQRPVKGRLQPGTIVEISDNEGVHQATVIKMGLKSVDVDSNHPLAGKTLIFEIDIVEVRDATAEEIAHGHAHGAGGHQH